MKHFTSGSSVIQLGAVGLLLSSAAGRYGICVAVDHAEPGGTLNAAPSANIGPWRATWASRSQLAVLLACQMPLRSGVPSAVRGAR